MGREGSNSMRFQIKAMYVDFLTKICIIYPSPRNLTTHIAILYLIANADNYHAPFRIK